MTQKHEDLTLLSVRSAFDHLRSTVNRALQRIERQQQLAHSELFSQVKERRKLAKTLLLDKRLIRIYHALLEKPSLTIGKQESLAHCELTSSVVTLEADIQTVKFALNGTEYTLRFTDRGGACISYYGETFKSSHLSLFDAAQQELLTIHLTFEGEGEQEAVSESQITCFVPGKWIYDVIHAYETLETKESLRSIDEAYSEQKLDQLRAKFGL